MLWFAFACPHTQPAPFLRFAAKLDFEDYDAKPPRVDILHPLTWEKLTKKSFPPVQLGQSPPVWLPTFVKLENRLVQKGDLFQEWAESEEPFVCLRGVRQYHNNPGHSGDSWWLHRGSGIGSLSFLLTQLIEVGTRPVDAAQFQFNITPSGYTINPGRIAFTDG